VSGDDPGFEFEGLKASAVAVALTVFVEFPQIREKNVGKAEVERVVQSVVGVPAGAEKVTVAGSAARLPTAFCDATACAAWVATPHTVDNVLAFEGSPVIPDIEMILAPASAAASAERCASSRAR
jgi:hypothetical protein